LAFADGRVALVIGNSAYQNAPALRNPKRDAQAIAASLRKGGYTVVSTNDVGNLRFKRAVRQFEDAAANADIAVVFYAGHGIEIGGINYMIPVDAKLASDRDAEDEAITLGRILSSVDGAKQLGLVILDACRDNPFISRMKRPRTAAMRAVTAGLALVEPTNPTRNTLIAYAAKTGFAAEDGDREHSPFTESLLKHLFEPGRDIRFAFGYIRDEVYESTGRRQEPYVSGSLGGEHISLVPALERATPVVDEKAQRDDFMLVDKLTDGAAPADAKRVWDAYLAQHTNGLYHELARQRRDKLALVVQENTRTPLPNPPDGPRLAAIDPGKPPSPPSPSSEEQRAWDRIKDSSNQAALRDFIRRYPSSVLANTAQTRLQALESAAQEQAAEETRQKAEREAKARAEREAKAAEEARQKAEREAAVRRAEEERLAKLVEATRAAAAEAARQRQAEAERKKAEEEAARQRAEAAEAERKRLAQEAARKRAEAAEAERQKAEQDRARKLAEAAEAERKKLEQEAARERAEEERRAAELERQKAEREAAIKRAEEERLAKQAEEEAERQRAEREAALRRVEEERLARQAEVAERQEAERLAALQRAEEERVRKQQEETERASREATCRREADRLAELRSTRDQSKAREDLKRLQEELTCERLRPSVTAALEKIEKPEPVFQQRDREEERGSGRHRQRAKPEESGKSAARHRNEEAKPSRQRAEEAKPSRQRAKREESRPQPRVRQEARTAPVRHSGGGGGVLGVGF
jgi:uncharacterized caspase-like protein